MNQYEVLYIVDNSLSEEAKDAVVAKFEGVIAEQGGTVEKTDRWGTKKLAYPIDYKTDGYYVLMTFAGSAELPKELERQMGITEEIMRKMVIRKA